MLATVNRTIFQMVVRMFERGCLPDDAAGSFHEHSRHRLGSICSRGPYCGSIVLVLRLNILREFPPQGTTDPALRYPSVRHVPERSL